MSERRDLDARVEQWLKSEAGGRAPDRMFGQVFATTSRTRQVRAWPGSVQLAPWVAVPVWVLLAVAILAALVFGAVVGAPRLLNTHPPSQPPTEPRAVRGSVVAVTCPHPSDLVPQGSALWIVCPDQVRRFDAQGGQVTGVLAASGFAGDASAIWVARGDSVAVLDPVTLAQSRSVPLSGAGAIALDATSAWILEPADKRVLRVDRRSLATTASIAVPAAPSAVVVAAGSVWVAVPDSGLVIRIDPATNGVAGSISVEDPATMTSGASGIWVLDGSATTVSQIDPATNTVRRQAFLPSAAALTAGLPRGGSGPPAGVALDGSSLWEVAGTEAIEVDAANGEVVRWLRLSAPSAAALTGAAASNGRLVLLDAQSDRVLEVTP